MCFERSGRQPTACTAAAVEIRHHRIHRSFVQYCRPTYGRNIFFSTSEWVNLPSAMYLSLYTGHFKQPISVMPLCAWRGRDKKMTVTGVKRSHALRVCCRSDLDVSGESLSVRPSAGSVSVRKGLDPVKLMLYTVEHSHIGL